MTPQEMQERIEELERQLAAVMRVLWTIRGEYKGASGKMEKELQPYTSQILKRDEMRVAEPVTIPRVQILQE